MHSAKYLTHCVFKGGPNNIMHFFKVQGHLNCFPLKKFDDEISSTKDSQVHSTGKNSILPLKSQNV